MIKLYEPSKSLVVHYPDAVKFRETQQSIMWTSKEVDVSKDVMDIKVHMTEAESHGVITTLKLFTLYELFAGDEYWLGRVLRNFPRPEIQAMASVFGSTELAVHSPFYNQLNEALNLNTEEFYNSYVDNDILKERMEFIGSIVDDPDDLVSLGVFSLIEGAILYSSFAFLKHFQAKGKNKLLNVVRGINFSVRDENLHSLAGAWLYRSLRDELVKGDPEARVTVENSVQRITEASRAIYEHESQIVDMIFEKGEIEGITARQMKTFVKSRINLCLSHLGISEIFDIVNNDIADWFYDSINTVQFGDFFTGTLSEYNRDWDQSSFKW